MSSWPAPSLLGGPIGPGFPGCLHDKDYPLLPTSWSEPKAGEGPAAQVAFLDAVGKGSPDV